MGRSTISFPTAEDTISRGCWAEAADLRFHVKHSILSLRINTRSLRWGQRGGSWAPELFQNFLIVVETRFSCGNISVTHTWFVFFCHWKLKEIMSLHQLQNTNLFLLQTSLRFGLFKWQGQHLFLSVSRAASWSNFFFKPEPGFWEDRRHNQSLI